jgi:hypothetical protein
MQTRKVKQDLHTLYSRNLFNTDTASPNASWQLGKTGIKNCDYAYA